MYRLRPAASNDLPTIYNLQNIPYRERVFVDPLPSQDEFVRNASEKMHLQDQYYYIFEQNGSPLGWIEYQKNPETTSIWGKWFSTLVYGCALLAFDDLKFSRLNWYTRAINKPMLKTCEKMKFRKTGEREVCNITQGFSFIAIGKIFMFELTSAEFQANRNWMQKLALPVEFCFRNAPAPGAQQTENTVR